MKDIRAILFVLFAAILWGTTGTAQAYAPEEAHPIAFGAMRLAFGGIALLMFASLQQRLTLVNFHKKRIILAAVSMALYQPLFFSAVKSTGIAVGTVVAIGSAPIIAGVIEWVTTKKRPPKKWWGATCLAILGSFLLLLNKHAVTINPLGMLMAFGAGFSFATYTLVSKKLIGSNSPNLVVAVIFSISACLLAPVLLFYDLAWISKVNGLTTTLYLGIFATALAYLLFSKGLKNISASTGVTLALAEPLTAALLGAFLIGETLPLRGWIGVSLILFAIITLSITPRKQKVIPPQSQAT